MGKVKSHLARIRIDRSPRQRLTGGRPRAQITTDFHAQAKLMRVMELIMFLQSCGHTAEELAERLGQSCRTIYRYLYLLEALGFAVEKDFESRYFLVEDGCPLCGTPHKNKNALP